MKLNVTIEVESPKALATILKTGADYALYDYEVLAFRTVPEGESAELRKLVDFFRGSDSMVGRPELDDEQLATCRKLCEAMAGMS